MVILGADQERNSCLVESTALPVPFLDGIQCALAGEVKHKQNRNGVIAHKRKHIDEFALTAQIPDRESDLRVPDGDCFFHEIHPC